MLLIENHSESNGTVLTGLHSFALKRATATLLVGPDAGAVFRILHQDNIKRNQGLQQWILLMPLPLALVRCAR